MPNLTQTIGGDALDALLATFATPGGLIDPTSTSFIYGQVSGAAPNYNFTTQHISAFGENMTYDSYGPSGGTLTSFQLHAPHISSTNTSGDHTGTALVSVTGAAFNIAQFRLAILFGNKAALQAMLEQQQWTFTGSQFGDVFTGGVFADSIVGNDGNDTLSGGGGSDDLYGGLGADSLTGGDDGSIDYVRYDDANYGSLTIRLDGGANTGAAAGDVYVGIEGAIGGAGWDNIYGNDVANHLLGKGGNDGLRGGAGNDTLDGGEGSDHLYGGEGADSLIGGDGAAIDYARYDDANYGSLTIRLDGGANTGAALGDVFVGIEGIVGGAGWDTIYGNGAANHLLGKGGTDIIRGGAGNDTLDGGDGADHLYGGDGADQLIGGDGSAIDYARYDDANYGNLTIRLDGGAGTGAALGDVYVGIEGIVGGAGADSIYGNGSSNQLLGKGGNDSIRGGAGSDTLDGGDGSDHLSGGEGADRLIGGEGRDYARYDDGAWGNIVIRLDGGAGTGAAAGDSYSSIEGVIGGSGNDTIYGSTGADHLIGGTGNDFFSGNTGNDTIDGGWGADRIRFTTAPAEGNVDTIVGFQHGFDKIELSRSIFASIGPTLTADEFGSAEDPNNFIIYNQGTGQIFYDAGGSGSGPGPVQFAVVAINTVLDVNDFTMV